LPLGVARTPATPCPRIEEGPDEEMDMAALKEAQQLTGELSWLASRSRPDLSYSVGVMSRLLHRRPRYVCYLGWWAMRYVAGTYNKVLNYSKVEDASLDELVIAVDTSYAPPHENYKSIQGTMITHGKNLLMWSSTRQPFVAQSTCEAELIGYNESIQNIDSLAALVAIWGKRMKKKILGDSKSGISQLTSDGGSWRTRHLRIRSAKLRELVQRADDEWTIEHQDGNSLVSDGLTKALHGQKFLRYVEMLRLVDQTDDEKVIDDEKTSLRVQSMRVNYWEDAAKVLAGAGAALLLTEQKMIGTLLVGLAGLSLVKSELQKNQERPEKERTRPHKEPQVQKPPNMVRDEAAHLPHNETGVTGKARVVGESPLDTDSCFGTRGSALGLRAFRLTPEQSESNGRQRATADGDSKGYGKGRGGAAERGRVAYGSMASSSSGQTEGGLGEQSVHVRMSPLPGGGSESYVDVDVVLRAGQGASLEGADEDVRRSRNAQDVLPPRAGSNRTEDSPGVSLDPGAIHQNRKENLPWFLSQFWEPPTKKSDDWNLGLWREHGWAIRVHGKSRQRNYHPVHSSTPMTVTDLDSRRVTSVFEQDGRHRILEDQWTDPKCAKVQDLRKPWTGYTFFKMKVTDGSTPGPATSGEAYEPSEIVSDGSFEHISD